MPAPPVCGDDVHLLDEDGDGDEPAYHVDDDAVFDEESDEESDLSLTACPDALSYKLQVRELCGCTTCNSCGQLLLFLLLHKTVFQAVIRHEGRSAFFGHYNADIRGSIHASSSSAAPDDSTWRRHNDSLVRKISSSEVTSSEGQQAAYMLFYVSN